MSDYLSMLSNQFILEKQEKEINTLKNEKKVQSKKINNLKEDSIKEKNEFAKKIDSLEMKIKN